MYLTDDLPDIVLVLKHYGANPPRTSGQVNLKCPFHNDTHSSASFNTRENIFNCFACGMNGNSLQIIAKQERVDIREAKLPSQQGNNKGSSTNGSIRRSRGA